MSQSEKSAYFQALKAAGVTFDKHYREYDTATLKEAYDRGVANGSVRPVSPDAPSPAPEFPPADAPQAHFNAAATAAAFAQMSGERPAAADLLPPTHPQGQHRQQPVPPVAPRDPNEMAGARLNTQGGVPIRTDDRGRVWYQEEVLKPSYPKQRGRRVLRYMDPGVEEKTVKAGQYTETFEVSGDPRNARPAEVKITLPSYQVGIYKDPRFPFKVVTYNGNEGFAREDVITFYGGAELVPTWIKRKYVENVLCYDIRSVVQAINNEYREMQLRGGRR